MVCAHLGGVMDRNTPRFTHREREAATAGIRLYTLVNTHTHSAEEYSDKKVRNAVRYEIL